MSFIKHSLLFFIACLISFSGGAVAGIVEINGKIVDAATQAPVVGAEVRLLEDGPSKQTDDQGVFHFELSPTGPVHYAVAIKADGYRPREANVQPGKANTLSLAKANAYSYFEPVQLDDGIKTGSLAQAKLNKDLVQKLMDKAVGGNYKEPHSILVYRNNVLALEEYFFGNNDTIKFEGGIERDSSPAPIQWGRTSKHYVASVNKALTGTVVGIVLDKYKKSVSDKISQFLPKRAAFFEDKNKAQITIRDMVTMQTGFYWDEWTRGDLNLLWQSNDFTEFLLSHPNNGPRSEWKYCSASPNVMWEVMDNIVGGSVRDWADKNFYKKLGITDYDLKSQPGGLPEGAARMHMRSRDMLKVGVTYLNGGVWNGQQVVPAKWVKDVFKVQAHGEAGDYSYYFWHRDLDGVHYVAAEGDGGQFINIFPTLNMVVVITQGNYLEWPLYVKQASDMMSSYIFPAAGVVKKQGK